MGWQGCLVMWLYSNRNSVHVYSTTRKILSANMGFGSANIERYYTVQQLIAQHSSLYFVKYVSLVKISSSTERPV